MEIRTYAACNETALLDRIRNLSNTERRYWRTTTNSGTHSLTLCEVAHDYVCSLLSEVPLASVSSVSTQSPNTFGALPLEGHGRPSHVEIWCYGLLAICTVCSCAAFGICLYPIMKKDIFQHILTWMIGLAVGCLSGIAILHLIPQAYELESHVHSEHYLHKSVGIMAAIYFFFVSERLFRFGVEYRKQKQEKAVLSKERSSLMNPTEYVNGHVHLDGAVHNNSWSGHSLTNVCGPARKPSGTGSRRPSGAIHVHDIFQPTEAQLREEHRHNQPDLQDDQSHLRTSTNVETPHVHLHGQCDSGQPLQTVAWMILTGDGIVDGLSIGAAFSISLLRGLSISLAVMCEELPHELGDLAILLNSGLSLKRAILYNCLSGLPCFLGFAVGVFLGELPAASSWIFALAAGMFIYISYVNMLPEMTLAVETASRHSIRDGVSVFLIQNFGLLFGIILTYVLARFSDKISFE